MSIVNSAISAYVDQMSGELLTKMYELPKTLESGVTKLFNIGTSQTLNMISNSAVVLQDGADCAFTPSGDLTISQRTLTVVPVKIQESLCPKTQVLPYFEQKYVRGSVSPDGQVDLGELIDKYFSEKVLASSKALENLIWNGSVALTGDTSLKWIDGIIATVGAASTEINVTGTTITTSNVIAELEKVYSAMPIDVIENGGVIYCGTDVVNKYRQAIATANLFHYNGTAGIDYILSNPDVKIVGIPALSTTDKMVATYPSNIAVGFGFENEEEFKFIFAEQGDQNYHFTLAYSVGVQVAFPDKVVLYS